MNTNFNDLTQREWLITNGLGGYASSTLVGANSRRYHGLLVAAFNPPTDRQVLVSKIEGTLFTDQGTVGLSEQLLRRRCASTGLAVSGFIRATAAATLGISGQRPDDRQNSLYGANRQYNHRFL